MKQHSQLYKFFIGQRIPIDEDKLNYKELLYLKWNRFIRWFTNFLYSLLIQSLGSLGLYSVIKKSDYDNIFNSISSLSITSLVSIGYITVNIGHIIINKISKEKTHKNIVRSGNPVPKNSKLGILFMIILFAIPAILWLIGAFIIKIKCRTYKSVHGSLERPEQRLSSELDINKKVLEHTTTAIGKVIKETLK